MIVGWLSQWVSSARSRVSRGVSRARTTTRRASTRARQAVRGTRRRVRRTATRTKASVRAARKTVRRGIDIDRSKLARKRGGARARPKVTGRTVLKSTLERSKVTARGVLQEKVTGVREASAKMKSLIAESKKHRPTMVGGLGVGVTGVLVADTKKQPSQVFPKPGKDLTLAQRAYNIAIEANLTRGAGRDMRGRPLPTADKPLGGRVMSQEDAMRGSPSGIGSVTVPTSVTGKPGTKKKGGYWQSSQTFKEQVGEVGLFGALGERQKALGATYIPSLSKISEKGAEFREAQPEIAGKVHGGFSSFAEVVTKPFTKKQQTFVGSIATGAYGTAREKPIQLAAEVGVGAALGPALRGVSVGAKALEARRLAIAAGAGRKAIIAQKAGVITSLTGKIGGVASKKIPLTKVTVGEAGLVGIPSAIGAIEYAGIEGDTPQQLAQRRGEFIGGGITHAAAFAAGTAAPSGLRYVGEKIPYRLTTKDPTELIVKGEIVSPKFAKPEASLGESTSLIKQPTQFIGGQKTPYTKEFFVKVDPAKQAEFMETFAIGKGKRIKTEFGRFYEVSGITARPPTMAGKMITGGTEKKSIFDALPKIHVEKKVKLTPTELKMGEGQTMQLPEFAESTIIDVRSRLRTPKQMTERGISGLLEAPKVKDVAKPMTFTELMQRERLRESEIRSDVIGEMRQKRTAAKVSEMPMTVKIDIGTTGAIAPQLQPQQITQRRVAPTKLATKTTVSDVLGEVRLGEPQLQRVATTELMRTKTKTMVKTKEKVPELMQMRTPLSTRPTTRASLMKTQKEYSITLPMVGAERVPKAARMPEPFDEYKLSDTPISAFKPSTRREPTSVIFPSVSPMTEMQQMPFVDVGPKITPKPSEYAIPTDVAPPARPPTTTPIPPYIPPPIIPFGLPSGKAVAAPTQTRKRGTQEFRKNPIASLFEEVAPGKKRKGKKEKKQESFSDMLAGEKMPTMITFGAKNATKMGKK